MGPSEIIYGVLSSFYVLDDISLIYNIVKLLMGSPPNEESKGIVARIMNQFQNASRVNLVYSRSC